MPNTVTVEEAPIRRTDLVASDASGEEWLVVDHTGHPVVKLVPPIVQEYADPTPAHSSLFGMMKGKSHFPPGWDDPLEDFKPYMEGDCCSTPIPCCGCWQERPSFLLSRRQPYPILAMKSC